MPKSKRWHAQRLRTVGASEAASLFGLNPWLSELQLWALKRGITEAGGEESEYMEWGNRLEGVIAKAYSERTGRKVKRHQRYTVSPLCERLSCHPDFGILGDFPGLLEVKNVGVTKSSDWEDGAPLHYQIQLQAQLACTGLSWGSIAALVGGQKLMWHDYQRNDAFIATLVSKVTEFWRRVEEDDPPLAVVGDSKILAQVFPGLEDEEPIALPPEAGDWDEQRQEAMEQIASWQAKKEEAEIRLKEALGASTRGVLVSGVSYTWRIQKRGEYVVKASETRVLRRTGGK